MDTSSEKTMPPHLIEIVDSKELFDALGKIEKTLSLNIDQTGELYVLISEIIVGRQKSENFINEVIKRLSVNKDLANKIAEETNKNIFDVVRNKLQAQSQSEENKVVISSIEKIGNFNIEKSVDSSQGKEPNVTLADRSKILNNLENPPTSTKETFSEPLVDHLLSNSSGKNEKKVDAPIPANLPTGEKMSAPNTSPISQSSLSSTPKPAEQKLKPDGGPRIDPYRELV